MSSKLKQLSHLYKRAAFDVHPTQLLIDINKPIKEVVQSLFDNSANYTIINILESPLKNPDREITKISIIKKILRSKKETQLINLTWLKKMGTDKGQIRERMTYFWHDHFACGGAFAYLLQEQNNTIRKHALGNFGDMLHAVAKDPAMILFLNNQENVKRSPNENFAREVMELFTLGIGNYSENDVKEAARAFTGWHINLKGKFFFNERKHDRGTKMFRNELGNFGGEDILNMLLKDKQTSNYICTKIYKEFVNENVNANHVKELSNVFYNSGYEISKVINHLLNANWFYSDENIGTKIISPVELLVRYQRLFNATFDNDEFVLASQVLLGQTLFMPPNVAGWKGGKDWIDSSTLMFRLRLPLMIFKDYPFEYNIKPDLESRDSDMMDRRSSKFEKLKITADWESLYLVFSKISIKDLPQKVVDAFIQAPDETIDKNMLSDFAKASKNNDRIKNLVIHVMSLPEFQLI